MAAGGQEASGKQLPDGWASLVCSCLPAQLHSQQTVSAPSSTSHDQTTHGESLAAARCHLPPPLPTALSSSSQLPGLLLGHEPSQPGEHRKGHLEVSHLSACWAPLRPGLAGEVLTSCPPGLRPKPHSHLPAHSKRAAMAESALGALAATSAARRPRAHRAGHTADCCALAIQHPPNSWTGAPRLTRPWVLIPHSCAWA